jgi:hypothetical protein
MSEKPYAPSYAIDEWVRSGGAADKTETSVKQNDV